MMRLSTLSANAARIFAKLRRRVLNGQQPYRSWPRLNSAKNTPGTVAGDCSWAIADQLGTDGDPTNGRFPTAMVP